jgi:hypothetical protein
VEKSGKTVRVWKNKNHKQWLDDEEKSHKKFGCHPKIILHTEWKCLMFEPATLGKNSKGQNTGNGE